MGNYIELAFAIIGMFFCLFAILLNKIKIEKSHIKEMEKDLKKNVLLYQLSSEWIRILQEGKSIAKYLEKHNYKKIAIYGMGILGLRLVKECKDSCVEVKYGIDKNAGKMNTSIPIIYPTDHFETVDAIIVTAIAYYEEVKILLSQKTDITILSLKDILDNM